MSKRKQRAAGHETERTTKAESSEVVRTGLLKKLFSAFRGRLWLIPVIALLAVGAFGSVMKYMQDEARTQNGLPEKDRSLLSSINPFVAAPLPSPTPQLSKEYIYAGSRLLAVEDAEANAAPPGDLAIWRPSTGQWWVLGGPGSQQITAQWGTSGDVPVPGDYDGDGKTDFAVFRKDDPTSGSATWYILNSSDSTWFVPVYGASTDTPAPADFDGDGKTDVAVYRKDSPSAGLGTWYIRQSSDSSTWYQEFGVSTDKPFPADHDGDGKADITVWRSSNNTFYSLRSSTGSLDTAAFGTTSTDPVSADYDGDGKADYAILAGKNWHILSSASLQTSVVSPSWGESTDIPVQNDYDGDGLVDVATWRASNGNWYIRQSTLIGQTGELRQVQWGMSGDIPVPAYYRR